MTEVVQIKKRAAKTVTPFVGGDIVYLKSGGPAMTVRSSTAVNRDGPTKVDVDWFVADEWMKGEFFAHQLVDKKPETAETAEEE